MRVVSRNVREHRFRFHKTSIYCFLTLKIPFSFIVRCRHCQHLGIKNLTFCSTHHQHSRLRPSVMTRSANGPRPARLRRERWHCASCFGYRSMDCSRHGFCSRAPERQLKIDVRSSRPVYTLRHRHRRKVCSQQSVKSSKEFLCIARFIYVEISVSAHLETCLLNQRFSRMHMSCAQREVRAELKSL